LSGSRNPSRMNEPYETTVGRLGHKSFALDHSDPAYRGQAVYTTRTLRAYDAIVVKLSNSLVWRCPARRIVAQYDRHVSAAHLDVGPGTAYYLTRCSFPDVAPDITLLDANVDVLRYAARRLERHGPRTEAADVLKPIGLDRASFRSVAMSYVLHCLPGEIDSKAVAFDNLNPLLEPGGVIFGTTILSEGVEHTRLGRKLLQAYNRNGIFSNLHDDRDALERALAARYDRYELEISGAVAFFAGWVA
jgi:ubiquinone/menaquinone biosynthesis C-methylase UbiE